VTLLDRAFQSTGDNMIKKYLEAALKFVDNESDMTVDALIGLGVFVAGMWILLISMMTM
jgi:hypothetical protein